MIKMATTARLNLYAMLLRVFVSSSICSNSSIVETVFSACCDCVGISLVYIISAVLGVCEETINVQNFRFFAFLFDEPTDF